MFRNREVRYFAAGFILASVFMAVVGFMIHPAAGILEIFSSCIFGMAFFFFTRKRYRRIAQTAEQIDRVLHNADRLYIGGEEEGELSILHSEITKMTVRIREQNDALQKEKEHLAEAMADIAHQLRTPLTSANLILSLLEDSEDKKEQRILLRELEDLLVRMDWLITSLLKLARLDAGIIVFAREEIDLEELMQAALQPLSILLDLHNIAVREKGLAHVKVYGDFAWLSEAFRNVLKNCMENTGDNGQIEISCEDTVLFAKIFIRDYGEGIAAEDLPHVFERFYQGKKQGKNRGMAGYGIGLALCKKIIAGQEGTIIAKNHPQGGAVFVIRLPK